MYLNKCSAVATYLFQVLYSFWNSSNVLSCDTLASRLHWFLIHTVDIVYSSVHDITYIICFQVEGLLDEKDFKAPVKRSDCEELWKDLFDRVTKPVEDALKVSEITLVGIMKCSCSNRYCL